MAKQVKNSKAEIATIDCCLVTIETTDGEFGFDTANKVEVAPQIETVEAAKLIVKGILRAQKAAITTITGNKITLADNVFNPELVLVLQGGRIIYDTEEPTKIIGYEPPIAGSADKGEIFKLNVYSAQYDASGQIKQYEKISYPNAQGAPVAFGSEDGAFRAPVYEINSAPNTGEPPYRLTYVKQLPALVDEYSLGVLEVVSVAGATEGNTKIGVMPVKEEYTNKYMYKTSATEITLPAYGEVVAGYTNWDGIEDITAATGQYIAILECTADGKALSGGTTTVVSAS